MVLNAWALLRVELGWNFLEVAACITQCNQMAEITHLRVDLCYFFIQVFFELPQALVHAHRKDCAEFLFASVLAVAKYHVTMFHIMHQETTVQYPHGIDSGWACGHNSKTTSNHIIWHLQFFRSSLLVSTLLKLVSLSKASLENDFLQSTVWQQDTVYCGDAKYHTQQ